MVDTTCKRCMLFATKGKNTALLQEYLDSIPEAEWTPQQLYRERLEICKRCGDYRYGMCYHCADFIEVRCARRDSSCPASRQKW